MTTNSRVRIVQFPGISFEISADRARRVQIAYRGVPQGAWCYADWSRDEAARAIRHFRKLVSERAAG